MLSLRDLLHSHDTVLLIDSSSAETQVALLRAAHDPIWASAVEEAGGAIFSCTDRVLTSAQLTLSDVRAFVFCDGPGSVLGIRTAAVALRTWQVLAPRPCYAFCGLAVVAHALALAATPRPFSVIADARRDTWHRVTVDADAHVSALQRVPTAELTGAVLMPENYRHWSTPPAQITRTHYQLAHLFPAVADLPLFAPAPEPDAFLHEEPSYQTWTPKIHRAPA